MSESLKVDWDGVPDTFEFKGETYKSVRTETTRCDGCAFDVDDSPCFSEGFPPCSKYTDVGIRRFIFVKVA